MDQELIHGDGWTHNDGDGWTHCGDGHTTGMDGHTMGKDGQTMGMDGHTTDEKDEKCLCWVNVEFFIRKPHLELQGWPVRAGALFAPALIPSNTFKV